MYREVATAPRLRSLVAGVWAFSPTEHVHRVLPDGCMDIVFLDHRVSLVGSMQTAITIGPQATPSLGIRLRPGEADRLFPGVSSELIDDEAPLADLWGDEGRRLEDALLTQLARGHDVHAILRSALPIVQDALAARLASHGRAADPRMRFAATLLGEGETVADVAARVCLSERQLARRFEQRVGLTPKTFARVRRLQRAALSLSTGAQLSHAASIAGYADQPHFTREASALAGISPRMLANELTDGRDTVVPVTL